MHPQRDGVNFSQTHFLAEAWQEAGERQDIAAFGVTKI